MTNGTTDGTKPTKKGLASTELWGGALAPAAAIYAIIEAKPDLTWPQAIALLGIAAIGVAYIWSRTQVKGAALRNGHGSKVDVQ